MTTEVFIQRNKSLSRDNYVIAAVFPTPTRHELVVPVANMPLAMEDLGLGSDGDEQTKILAFPDGGQIHLLTQLSPERFLALGARQRQ